jgi:tetratricopeptide (TPR) repeat protein
MRLQKDAKAEVGTDGDDLEASIKAATKIPWLVLAGHQKDEMLLTTMGKYLVVEGKVLSGRAVWQHEKEGRGYIFYSGDFWWLSVSKEDMEAGTARGLAKVEGGDKALTPVHTATGAWRVLSADGSFAPAADIQARSPGQQPNHFHYGITVKGFKLALQIMLWDQYVLDRNGWRTGFRYTHCPWNTAAESNGYDVCELIKQYLRHIGKRHLSFVEAVMEGEIEALKPLQSEVGLANAFYSHVQQVAVTVTVESMENAEEKHSLLLQADRPATQSVWRDALLVFQKHNNDFDTDIDTILHTHLDPAELQQWLQDQYGYGSGLEEEEVSVPDFQSLVVQKTEESCRFFVDYFCIRQCLNDFSVPHVLRAIKEIGLTVVELGTNWRSNDSPLFRMFCVLEIFGTAKARGALLVCGPALQEPAQVKDLLQVATDQDCSKEVMDSRNRASCRWAEEEQTIRQYICDSVGYEKLDNLVLAAIVRGCMQSLPALFKAQGAPNVLYGLATKLYNAQEYGAAVPWAQRGLHLCEAGLESGRIQDFHQRANHLLQIGECAGRAGTATAAQVQRWFEQAKEIYGSEHIQTARCLVGLGYNVAFPAGRYHTALELGRQALSIAEAIDGSRSFHSAGALALMGAAFWMLQQYPAALEYRERWLMVLEGYYGKRAAVAEIAQALRSIGDICADQGDFDKALDCYMQAVPIAQAATGKLSDTTGMLCQSIAVTFRRTRQYDQAEHWYARTAEAFAFTYGRRNERYTLRIQRDLVEVRRRQQRGRGDRGDGRCAAS